MNTHMIESTTRGFQFPGTFEVTLGADVTGRLFPGPYQLQLAASSDAVALISERRVDLEVAP